MSLKAMVWAFNQKCGNSTAKLVLLKLADAANDDGECWPSQALIAEVCELTREAVCRTMKKLAEAGLIEAEHRYGHNGGEKSKLYRLKIGVVRDDHTPRDRRSNDAVTVDHTNLSEEPSREPPKKETLDRRTETPTEPTEPSPTNARARVRAVGNYVFEGRIIRLTKKDFERWQNSFTAIPDIAAELVALDAYYDSELTADDRKKWFHRCAAALAKKHQTAVIESRQDDRPIEEIYPNEGVFPPSYPERARA